MVKKLQPLVNLIGIREGLKSQGKRVVFTNGCFDLIHGGHIHLLREAKKLGDVLVVAVNNDSSIRKIKGSGRPIFPLEERLEILESIEDIDWLVAFSQESPKKLIESLLPDVLVKGGDWLPEEVVGKQEVEEAGGKVIIIPFLSGHSSSEMVRKIIESAKSDL